MKSLLSLCELNIPVWELFIRLFIYLLKKKQSFSQQSVRRFFSLRSLNSDERKQFPLSR